MRRWFTLLLFALVTIGQANAQLTGCATQTPASRTVRPNGKTELVSDIVILCTGGSAPSVTVNVEAFLNTNLTSRILQTSNNATEALLLVDDPQPGAQQARPVGSQVTGANVYQGVRVAANRVAFQGVTFPAPGNGQRILRIVNLRADASLLQPQAQISAFISVTGLEAIFVNNPTRIVATVGLRTGFAVRNTADTAAFHATFDGCLGNKPTITANTPPDFNVKFTEAFPSDFRKRNTATTFFNPTSNAFQNQPGIDYGTEFGFFGNFPSTSGMNGAGVATQGTRLVASFRNIPDGVNVYVTTLPVVPGSSSATLGARLINANAFGAGGTPVDPTVGPYFRLAVAAGTATAVWEIFETSTTLQEVISFGVVFSIPAGTPASPQMNVAGQQGPITHVTPTPPHPLFEADSILLPIGTVQGCPLTISTACPLPPAAVGANYNLRLEATGGSTPFTWILASGSLPPGFILSTAGVISGSTTQSGTFSFIARVVDATGSFVDRTCSITVATSISITSACPLPEGLLNSPYNHTLTATGGSPPYAWSVTGTLPPGIALSGSGILTGIAAAQGLFSFALRATDQIGAFSTLDCSLRIGLPFTADPMSLEFSAPSGLPAPVTQLISLTRDTAGTPVSVRVTTRTGGSWLTATLLSSAIPGLVEVAASAAGLTLGAYEGSVIISTSGAAQQTVTVAVRLNVLPSVLPELSADPISLAVPRAAPPNLRNLPVFNRGPGSISFTAGVEFLSGQGWLNLSPASGTATAEVPARLRANFQTAALDPGTYRARIRIQYPQARQDLIVPVAVAVSSSRDAMLLAPAALGFQSVAPGSTPPQEFYVLSAGAGNLNWNAGVVIDPFQPNWLTLSQSSGTASPGNPSRVEARVNTAGLTPGRYFAEVLVRAEGAGNSPRILYVALNVLPNNANPGLSLLPSALLFLANPARPIPARQTFNVSNPSNSTVRFDFQLNGDSRIWTITGSPLRSLAPGASLPFTVAANTAGLPPGVTRASINFQAAGDPVSRQLDLLLIIGSTAPRTASFQPQAVAVCPPGGLQIQPLRQAIGFSSVTGIPLAVEARVAAVADASPVTTGVVTASLTGAANATTHLVHIDSDPGLWSGTLLPPAASTALALRLFAEDPARNVTGCIDMAGSADGGQAPVIGEGGIVSTSSFAPAVPLAPGGMAAIFGSRLADGSVSATSLPLPTQLGSTRVSISGRPVPLFFAGDLTTFSQINGILPYGLTPHISHQLSLRRAGQLAFSEVLVSEAQPGIFTVSQTGAGQGVIVHGANPLLLADAQNPIARGGIVIIYCEGLGPVSPSIEVGAQTPSSPLRQITLPIRVTIGGQEAVVQFAGLTPFLSGLYQINAVVPASATAGAAVPVVVTVAGQASNTATIALRP
ncbi:MAG: hypothetical protein FJW20_04305 [Acidimicrobiia bacterium]|nr:hypothetical protein [Acidimicrobiia bacterium]